MTRLRHMVGNIGRLATYLAVRGLVDLEPPDGRVALIGVYRANNASLVRPLVDTALAEGWEAAWWGLDEPAEELAAHTVGCGSGEKFPLLNEIVERAELDDGWLVVADDDVEFATGGLAELVALCARAGFALAQPAHTAASTHSHDFTLSRTLSVARATTFVEIGPVFVVAPWCRSCIVPFSTARGMGWGLELDWRGLAVHGCRIGIVDAITIVHRGIIGASYEAESLKAAMRDELAAHGAADWSDLQQTIGVWRPWRTNPRWVTGSPMYRRP